MATHSSILAWRIPWTEEPGRLRSMGSQRVGLKWLNTHRHMHRLDIRGFPGGTSGKELACQCRRCKRPGFNSWVRKIPWRRAWQCTPVFLPGESHGQRSLVGYGPWGRKELDTNDRLSTAQHTSFYVICLCPCLFICFISTFSSLYILEK